MVRDGQGEGEVEITALGEKGDPISEPLDAKPKRLCSMRRANL